MSPEQVQGTRLDGRADLYSLGIIVYEWLIGQPPFVSGDIAYQQVNVRPTAPAEQSSEIPVEVSDLIMKCIEKNPADRFQNARDLKNAVDNLVARLAPEGAAAALRWQRVTEHDLDTFS
jgi:serine/threonine-protein kinase